MGRPRKLALGLWTYTSRFDAILQKPVAAAPARIAGNHGLYVLFSQIVLADNNDPQRHMSVFARLAVANPRVNRFGVYTGAGVVFAGLFPGREQDVAGLAVAGVQNGDDYMRSRRLSGTRPERTEWNIELTYQAQITSWLSLHPDIQYIIHPDTNPAIRNPLGIDLRLNITL
jgi:porin